MWYPETEIDARNGFPMIFCPRSIYRVIFLMLGCQNTGCWVWVHFCTGPLRIWSSRLKIDQNFGGSLGAAADVSELRQRILDLSSALNAGRPLLSKKYHMSILSMRQSFSQVAVFFNQSKIRIFTSVQKGSGNPPSLIWAQKTSGGFPEVPKFSRAFGALLL